MPLCVPDHRCEICNKKSAEFEVMVGTPEQEENRFTICAEKACMRFVLYGNGIFGGLYCLTISPMYSFVATHGFDSESMSEE